MCLGEYAVIVDVIDAGRAVVLFHDGSQREVSLAVLAADGVEVLPGDVVMVSIGMALELIEPPTPEPDRSDLIRPSHLIREVSR